MKEFVQYVRDLSKVTKIDDNQDENYVFEIIDMKSRLTVPKAHSQI